MLELNRRQFLKACSIIPFAPRVAEAVLKELEPVFISSVFMYHEISYRRLKADLMNLLEQGANPISLETLVGILNNEVEIPQNPTFLVTCDDGLASQYEEGARVVNDIAGEAGIFIPLNLFVMTKFEDLPMSVEEIPDNTPSFNDGTHRYMSKEQLLEMIKMGHQVSNHTVNHGYLTRLSLGARNAEVEIGEERIQALWNLAGVSRTSKAFAYPFGVFNQAVVSYLADLGYDMAFSKLPKTAHKLADRLILGRIRKS